MNNSDIVLRLKDITRSFGSLVANDRVSFDLRRGEILALLGENGAGKTTLMNIIFGHYVADQGEVEVFNRVLPPGSPKAAIAAGIGMVHQHFTLAGNLSVLENILIGTRSLISPQSGEKAARKKIMELSEKYGLQVDTAALVRDLSIGEKQRVEILKVLYRDARILILDEPTAVLTPHEIGNLFNTLRRFVSQGLAIIFISHKMNEIMEISDSVVVLRQGKVTSRVRTAETTIRELAKAMVGSVITIREREPLKPGERVLEFRNLSLKKGLEDVSLSVRSHEILGIAGVSGNGQVELADVISGLLKPVRGVFLVHGKPVPAPSPIEMLSKGVGRIPEDRIQEGLIGDMSVWENLGLENYRDYSPFGLLRLKALRDNGRKLVKEFDVRCQSIFQPARLLSGGNIQKLILARVLSPHPGIILANQPCWGLDIAAAAFVGNRLLQARERGAGVILISEDLEEVMGLSDRIQIIFEGRLSDSMRPEEVTPEELGLLMTGHVNITANHNFDREFEYAS